MQIEVGKYYRTRDGMKVGPMARADNEGAQFYSNDCGLYFADGTFGYGETCRCANLDIIAEWTEALLARLDAGTCDTRAAAATIRRLSDELSEIATAKVDALRQPPHSARNPPWEDADPVVDAEEAWALQHTARDALYYMENGQ